MILLPSSADASTDVEAAPAVVDEARNALLEGLQAGLGEAIVEYHLEPGVDLTLRIANEAWTATAEYLREGQRFRFFDFISAIDWLPSPFGRSMDAAVDTAGDAAPEAAEMVTGLAGGDTRFQVFARVYSLTTNLGVTLKTDIGDDLTVGTWTNTYPGAEWHEREVWEMFGITIAGHPGLRPLYLPTDFEGNPLRKDFPLLARLIKPWPGIVDVEPMPEIDAPPSTENIEAAAVAEADMGSDPIVDEPVVGEAAAPEADMGSDPIVDEPVVDEPVVADVGSDPIVDEPVSEPVGEETDAADIASIPEHLLKRSRQAKGDAS